MFFEPSYITVAVVVTLGDVPLTYFKASIFSMSLSDMPVFMALPVTDTVIVLAPSSENCPITESYTPWTIVISAITAVTPIIIPSVVRNERILLVRIFLIDIEILCFKMSINSPIFAFMHQ